MALDDFFLALFVCDTLKLLYLQSWCCCFWQAAAAKGEAPPGLPLKGAGQDSTDAQPRVKTEKMFMFFSIMQFW